MAKATVKPKAEETKAAPASQDSLPGQDTPPVAQEAVLSRQGSQLIEVPMLIVVGPAKGRWRIGRKFTPEPMALVLADLTEEEIAALQADPELSVIGQMATAVAPAAGA